MGVGLLRSRSHCLSSTVLNDSLTDHSHFLSNLLDVTALQIKFVSLNHVILSLWIPLFNLFWKLASSSNYYCWFLVFGYYWFKYRIHWFQCFPCNYSLLQRVCIYKANNNGKKIEGTLNKIFSGNIYCPGNSIQVLKIKNWVFIQTYSVFHSTSFLYKAN